MPLLFSAINYFVLHCCVKQTFRFEKGASRLVSCGYIIAQVLWVLVKKKKKKKKDNQRKRTNVEQKLTFQQDSSSGCYFVNKALSNYDINWVKFVFPGSNK